MIVRDLIENLPAHVVYGVPGYCELPLGKVIAGDLMSDVLVTVETGILLVTSLATEQAVRSADIIGAPVILLVNDKLPTERMKALAGDCGVTLLATPMPMYEACVTIGLLAERQ